MLSKIDDIHYSFSSIDGYAKPYNFIIGPREGGKSSMFLATKAYKAFVENRRSTIYLRRDKNDITDIYIMSLQRILRKFKKENAELIYKRTKGEGFLTVYLKGYSEPFLYFIALNQEKSNFKSLVLGDVAYIVMDEFIIDTRAGEKYVEDEPGKLKELYETFNRESSTTIKCYFLGNPYSLFNPYFLAFGIDPKTLDKGVVRTGKTWACERYKLNPLLVEQIKKKNPMFDEFANDAWAKYALEGEAVNDINIRIMDKPTDYSMQACIIFEGRYYGIWRATGWGFADPMYFVSRENSIGKKRMLYAFDFKDLINNSKLYDSGDKLYLKRFKMAISNRMVGYQDLDCNYTIEALFDSI